MSDIEVKAVALLNMMNLEDEKRLTRGHIIEGRAGVYYLDLKDLVDDIQEHLI